MAQAVVDNLVDGVIVIDSRGTVETFNPAATRMFGYAAAEVVGHNVKKLMPEPTREEHDGNIGNYLKTGKAKIIGIGREVTALHKDDTHFPIDLTITEMTIADQPKFVGITRDLTEHKQATALIAEQSRALLELSTPVISVWDEIVLLPIIGVIDSGRAQQIIENLLGSIVRTESRVAIIDVTGVPVIDTMVAHHLLKTVAAAKMLGTQVVLAGISPEIAQTLVKLRIDLSAVHCAGSLRSAMAEALRAVGHKLSTEAAP